MDRELLRLVEAEMAALGFDPGPVDGVGGPATDAAAQGFVTSRAAQLNEGWERWSPPRRLVAALQLTAARAGLDTGPIDGLIGPRTEAAAEILLHRARHGVDPPPWRDALPADRNPHGWPVEREADLVGVYGPVGEGLVRVEVQWPHRLAWDPDTVVRSFLCAARVKPSIERAQARIVAHYGVDRLRALRLDLFGGCFEKRRKRGGTAWSTHAWGIALDYDPESNKLRWGRDRATLAGADYEPWWTIWEEEGWVSLGRSRNFDWMHLQAARLP